MVKVQKILLILGRKQSKAAQPKSLILKTAYSSNISFKKKEEERNGINLHKNHSIFNEGIHFKVKDEK